MVGQGAERLIPARFKKKTKAGELAQLVKHVPPNHRDYSCSPRFHGCCEKTIIPAAERQETETRMCWPSTSPVDNTASIFHLCPLAEDHHSRSDHQISSPEEGAAKVRGTSLRYPATDTTSFMQYSSNCT
ncbi:hypothetical protein LEMLEM_LOCUS7199 [Lemmus lemmus]